MAPATTEAVETVRRRVGLWTRDDHTFVRLSGPDVASWLQTQTTNDVKALASGQGHANALLDRKGRLQAHFTLHRWEDEYWLVVEKAQAERLLSQLDAHLFLEQVEMADVGDEVEQVVVQGPRSAALLAALAGPQAAERLPSDLYACRPVILSEWQVLCFRLSVTGEDGFLVVAQAGESGPLVAALLEAGRDLGAQEVPPEAREVLRIEAGIPRFGVDMDDTYRIPETTLERTAVSYDKGCYLGQEVVARLRAYASVKQALMGLLCEEAGPVPPPGTELRLEGRKVGHLVSGTYSPTLARWVVMAYLDRDHRAPGVLRAFEAGGVALPATVTVLPFYEGPDRGVLARSRYEQALDLFDRDFHDQDDRAIRLLEEAVVLSPRFEDAYEALGVILNRHGRVDEAIHYMRTLARLNPDCIMAHTNLSVFYVQKGMIEEAEMEKAQASVLQIRQASAARQAEEVAAAERERIRAEAAERIGMFREVLELDPEDPLATYGMGAAHMQLGEYEDAVPYLASSIRINKDYSAAYLNLGKCLEFLDRAGEAVEVYRQGIEAATRKGDLMPMREMERRMKTLKAK